MLSVKDINFLQAQNDGLIKQNKDLQAENKQLKELFGIESLTDIKTGETMYRSRQIMYFVDILQEIKEIAEKDFNHTCWKEYAKQLKQIIDIINKSEEE